MVVVVVAVVCGEAGHPTAGGMFPLHALQMIDLTHHVMSARGRRDGYEVDSPREECTYQCANETRENKSVFAAACDGTDLLFSAQNRGWSRCLRLRWQTGVKIAQPDLEDSNKFLFFSRTFTLQ